MFHFPFWSFLGWFDVLMRAVAVAICELKKKLFFDQEKTEREREQAESSGQIQDKVSLQSFRMGFSFDENQHTNSHTDTRFYVPKPGSSTEHTIYTEQPTAAVICSRTLRTTFVHLHLLGICKTESLFSCIFSRCSFECTRTHRTRSDKK